MSVPKTIPATHARASLLDRLIDKQPQVLHESRPLRVLPIDEWKQALLRDLTWLLNTACPVSEAELEQRPQRTVIDYGLPDFSTFFTENPLDHRRLKKWLEKTLAAYEPRLKNLQVTIATTPTGEAHRNLQVGLNAKVEAVLLIDKEEEPVAFMIQETIAGRKEIVQI